MEKLITDLVIELQYWAGMTSQHDGSCEYTDKVDEGCYLCEEAHKERFPITKAILDEAKEFLNDQPQGG